MDNTVNTMAIIARGFLFIFIIALLIPFVGKIYNDWRDKQENKKIK